MYTHTCIKPGCGVQYTSDDQERYYCEACNEARKVVAAEIDAKYGSRAGEEVVSDLQAYEAEAKSITTPEGRTVSFARTTL
jgi:hypothetical protein